MPLPFAFKIKHFTELPSTNDYARQQAELGAEEGMVYVSNHQTAGRGQFDRKWESAAGKNLLFSVLLRPPVTPAHAPIVTQLVSHSIAKTLEKNYKISCTLKKPNDILVNGRKICGVLVESSSRSPKKVESVIIGVGLNVNQAPPVTPPAISMKDVLKKELILEEVLQHLLFKLKEDLEELYKTPNDQAPNDK